MDRWYRYYAFLTKLEILVLFSTSKQTNVEPFLYAF